MSTAEQYQRAVESRAEVESLQALHAEKSALMAEFKMLKPLHGPFGKWDSRRRALRAAIRLQARVTAEAKQMKVNESYLDDLAEGSDAYLALIDEGIAAAVRYTELEHEISIIDDRIQSRQTELLVYNSELRLAPR
jgi:hypothetical protein